MAKTDNLGDFLTDVADAIRTKQGLSTTINAQDFNNQISTIPSATDNFTTTFGPGSGEESNMYQYIRKIPRIKAEGSNIQRAFANCTALEEIGELDMTNANNTMMLFYNCTQLKSVTLNYADNMARLDKICYNCQNLEDFTINMSASYINADPLEYAFYNCYKLKKIDLSKILYYQSSYTYAFYNCYKLEELDLDQMQFNPSSSTTGVFTNCGRDNETPTKVYVKNTTVQSWILGLSSDDRPDTWTTANVIVAGSAEDLR